MLQPTARNTHCWYCSEEYDRKQLQHIKGGIKIKSILACDGKTKQTSTTAHTGNDGVWRHKFRFKSWTLTLYPCQLKQPSFSTNITVNLWVDEHEILKQGNNSYSFDD